ncbi:MAG: hypothetical protein HKP16_04300 [Xanthomonadales bacterium]|nr:hypothetical protein [Xanthomonadales bacterium]
MTRQQKLELLRFLIFLRGKLQNLSIELLMLGEDPSKVDAAEKKLARLINKLRVNLMRSWQGNAANLMADLRKRNERAQRRLRELKDAQDRAGKIADILKEIDDGLSAVLQILP